MRFKVATLCLVGLLSRVPNWGCYPGVLFEVATSVIMMDNNIVNLTLLITGWVCHLL